VTARLSDVVAALDALYPPHLAESWDAVGLVCGDPDAVIRRVLLAVDPVAAVAREALDMQADLLLTHHPLYLRGITSVAATTPKGRLVHELVSGGCGLLVAHTNADVARPGVSDALADRFGLTGTAPLEPLPAAPLDKLVVFVPVADAERLLDALAAAGAGELGDYDRCAWTTTGLGTFRPLPGARPAVGAVGEVARVVERLAVCGGAGDSALDAAARAGADAYLTADLRHHPASEAPEGLALLDAAHWATEWPWLADAGRRLERATRVQTRVSSLVTDPWTHHSRSPQA